ncbi:MAG TPA: hypothetical protein VND15_02095 [Candidatus Acidoferrales bacterium]|nr:hypothetical protein [Candidatus Acidoferrales bacterium]
MKTTTKIGILLVIVGVIVLFGSGAAANKQLQRQLASVNMTAQPHSFAYTDIKVNASSMIFITVATSNSSNIYLFNSSAFNTWSTQASNATANGEAYAAEVNGRGLLYTYGNSSFVQLTLPDMARNSSYNFSRVFNGNYYLVIDNTNSSAAKPMAISARAAYVVLNSNTVSSYLKGITYGVGGALALIITGVVVIIYGFFKKKADGAVAAVVQKTKSDTTSKEYIDSLYKDIEGKKGGAERKSRAKKAAK